MAIPVEVLERSDTVATYRLQDLEKAREHRDRLKAEGKNAFLLRHEGRGRYDGAFWLQVAKTRNAS